MTISFRTRDEGCWNTKGVELDPVFFLSIEVLKGIGGEDFYTSLTSSVYFLPYERLNNGRGATMYMRCGVRSCFL